MNMNFILISLLTLHVSPPTPGPESIAKMTVRTLGDTTQQLALEADQTITDPELDLLYQEIKTGSSLSVDPNSAYVLSIRRISPQTVRASLRFPDSKIAFLGQFEWASDLAPDKPLEEGPTAVGDTSGNYGKVLQFRREKLELRPVIHSQFITPTVVLGRVGTRPFPRLRTDVSFGARMFQPHITRNWAIYRGAVQRLTELEFAEIIKDSQLLGRIKTHREDHKFKWRLGFGIASGLSFAGGGLAMAALAQNTSLGGASLSDRARTSYGSLAGALFTTGVVTLIVALFPSPESTRLLKPHQTQLYCDRYNEELRHRLDLSPHDIR